MKAILVIDVDDKYLGKEISLIKFTDDNAIYCSVELKPMPYRYVEDKVKIETLRDAEVCTYGIQIGRNIVINEILGE